MRQFVFVLLFLPLLFLTEASAVEIDSCSDEVGGNAPATFDDEECASMCTYDSGSKTLICSLTACSGEDATIVTNFSGSGTFHFSAWGTCNGDDWCCVVKDDGTSQEIDHVTLKGSPGDDFLFFREPFTGTRLEPHRTGNLSAMIQGKNGGDWIEGSSSTSASYAERLHGDNAGDVIKGFAGDDILRGHNGNDTLEGNAGNDRMDGGDGADTLKGDDGDDVYCDTSEDSTSACTSNTFIETVAGNDDTFWLEYSAACDPAGDLDGTSTANTGTDTCGDSAWGSPLWTGCTGGATISSEPALCP